MFCHLNEFQVFRKCLDTVNILLLIKKLQLRELVCGRLNLVEFYLLNRQHYVVMNVFRSSSRRCAFSGTPQDPVLTSTLFPIFINDLTEALENHYLVYADDLKLLDVVWWPAHCN